MRVLFRSRILWLEQVVGGWVGRELDGQRGADEIGVGPAGRCELALHLGDELVGPVRHTERTPDVPRVVGPERSHGGLDDGGRDGGERLVLLLLQVRVGEDQVGLSRGDGLKSEEHTSELQSLMRISYAVFCLKKKRTQSTQHQSIIK